MIAEMAEAEGSCIHQVGGRGLFARVKLRVEPWPDARGILFVNQASSSAVPRDFVAAVERGARTALERGVLGGYGLSDVRVTLLDGKYHPSTPTRWLFKLRLRRRHPRQRVAPTRSCWSPSCGSMFRLRMNS